MFLVVVYRRTTILRHKMKKVNFEDINTDESDLEMHIPFIIKEKLKTRQVLQL